jgi:hypothetical protein
VTLALAAIAFVRSTAFPTARWIISRIYHADLTISDLPPVPPDHAAPSHSPTLRHRPRRLRSARLAQEAEGAGSLIFSI